MVEAQSKGGPLDTLTAQEMKRNGLKVPKYLSKIEINDKIEGMMPITIKD
jgi:hypothetical protein